jgi:O-antigen/teichoic acid export membrane protein
MLKNGIASDTMWLLTAYVLRLGLQAFSFVLIAKILGPFEFGSFSAFFSLCLLFAPFIELGCYFLIVRDVNLGISIPNAVGLALKPLIAMSVGSFFCVTLVCYFFLPSLNRYSIIPIGLAILLFARITAMVNGINASANRLWQNALIEIVGGLVLVVLVYLISIYTVHKEMVYWALFGQYLSSSLFAMVSALKTYGLPNLKFGNTKQRLKEGFSFAVGVFSYGANNEADKTLLARFSPLEIVGSYGLVTRIIVMSYVPLNAFLNSAFPRLSLLYNSDNMKFHKLSQTVFRITAAYGIFVSALLYIFAGTLSGIFGNEYSGIDTILQFAAGIVVLQAIQFPLADFLNISGFLQARAFTQFSTFIISILLNIYLIPIFSWSGSLMALYISTLLCLFILTYFAFYAKRKV